MNKSSFNESVNAVDSLKKSIRQINIKRSASILCDMNHNTIYIIDSVNVFIKASFINDRPLKIFCE